MGVDGGVKLSTTRVVVVEEPTAKGRAWLKLGLGARVCGDGERLGQVGGGGSSSGSGVELS
jgi:hypothetical protein